MRQAQIHQTGLNNLKCGRERIVGKKRRPVKRSQGVNRVISPTQCLQVLVSVLKNFYSWFCSPLPSFSPMYLRPYFLLQSLCLHLTTLSFRYYFTHFGLPPLSLSLFVYLSTFTVTALESQESKLPASPLPPSSQPIHAFHLLPSHQLRFISLYVSGVWKVHFIPPQGIQLWPVLVTQSYPPVQTP